MVRTDAGRVGRAAPAGDRTAVPGGGGPRRTAAGRGVVTPAQNSDRNRGARRAGQGRGARRAEEVRRRPGRWRAVWANGRLAALLGALVLVVTLAWVLSAPEFTVRRLDVVGASTTNPGDVAVAGGVMGFNVFTVDPQLVAERASSLPTVREAHSWNELPDRLVVRLVERQGAFLWRVGETRFLIDEGGFVIAADPAEDRTRGLLTVQATGAARDAGPPRVGGRIDPAAVAAALAVARPSLTVALPIVGLEWEPRGGLVLLGDGGWRIIFGSDARSAEKLVVCAELLKVEPPRGERGDWKILDVTDPDRPFYKEQEPRW